MALVCVVCKFLSPYCRSDLRTFVFASHRQLRKLPQQSHLHFLESSQFFVFTDQKTYLFLKSYKLKAIVQKVNDLRSPVQKEEEYLRFKVRFGLISVLVVICFAVGFWEFI